MRAVIVAGKMIQDHEFVYPYYRLDEAGYEVDVAVRGGETVFGQIGVKVEATIDIHDINPAEVDLLLIPGGAKAIEYMRQDQELLKKIRETHAEGKIIASICHGAQLLISAGLVANRRISGYYSIRDDINNAGGTYVDEAVVIDANVITTPHYKHLGPWMAAVVDAVNKSQNT